MVQPVKFVTRRQRVFRDAAKLASEHVRSLLAGDLDYEMSPAQRALTAKTACMLDAIAAPDNAGWQWKGGYMKASRRNLATIWDKIRDLDGSERPVQVRDAFVFLMCNIEMNTGQVELTRNELAAKIGCRPNHVSQIMNKLIEWGVLRKEMVRVPGMRGQGILTYYVNPEDMWNGSGESRAAAIKRGGFAPRPTPGQQLTVVQGGLSDDAA